MILTSIVLLGIVVLFNPVSAQTTGTCTGTGINFIDADGDGYNDNAPDHDGDGIPNGMDDDYTSRHGGRGFVDADGDGYNDNALDSDGDGIPNGMDDDFVRGSGFGHHGSQIGGFRQNSGYGHRRGGKR